MSDNNKEVGQATAGKAIKNRWRKESGRKTMSLKAFARLLVKEGDQLAKDWFACKNGALNAERSDVNKKRIETEKAATKNAKKGSKK